MRIPFPHPSKHATIFWSMLALVAYFTCYYFIGYRTTGIVLNILLTGISLVVSISWFPSAVDAFKNAVNTAVDKVIIVVWGVWTTLAVQRFYALMVYILDRPEWLINGPYGGLIGTVILILGTYAAYATISDTDVPATERRHVLFATFIGGAFVGGSFIYGIVIGFDNLGQ